MIKYLVTLLLAFNAYGAIPYNPQVCPAEIGKEFDVAVSGKRVYEFNGDQLTADIDGMMNFVGEFLNQIEQSFIRASDPAFMNLMNPLCFGTYLEPKGVNAFAYLGNTIMFGHRLILEIQRWGVDPFMGIRTVLAHEFAHIIQARLEVPFRFPLRNYAQKQKELQADCLAGVLMTLHAPAIQNVVHGDILFSHLADHHGVGDHGVFLERKGAWEYGMTTGARLKILSRKRDFTSTELLKACETNYPRLN